MESTVVKALSEQHNIRECVVDGQDDLKDFVSFGHIFRESTSHKLTIVGRTLCMTAPMILAKSPRSHMITNSILRPSALLRRKFSMI